MMRPWSRRSSAAIAEVTLRKSYFGARLKRIAAIGLSLLVLEISLGVDRASAADCGKTGTFQLTSPGPWGMSITTRSGTPCAGTFGSFGQRGLILFKRLYLVTAPKHGRVSLREGGYYTYSARAGFLGVDQFRMRVCGTQMNFEGCADLDFTATVN
jgi:hypothetical protein